MCILLNSQVEKMRWRKTKQPCAEAIQNPFLMCLRNISKLTTVKIIIFMNIKQKRVGCTTVPLVPFYVSSHLT